jgi:hypothetical protein
MEIQTTTEFQVIYPAYVMHKKWNMPDGYNDRLFDLALIDCEKNKITTNDDPSNVGDTSNHLGHLRHNFLTDTKDDAIVVLVQMADQAIREYLKLAYEYEHTGEISMMSDTFYQNRAKKENIGINTHTHIQTDIVCTYYPRVMLDADAPDTSLHKGSLRFYDPSNVGKRLWTINNKNDRFIGGWYSVTPETGSMMVFEGYVPHDSTYFEGDERMCIPILCSLVLTNSHCKVNVGDILAYQKGE